MRNALLPQVTGFALALGTVVTSGLIVEGVFGLPGIGTVLNDAIRSNDFPVIYGIVLFITIAVAMLMVVVELLYPLLDPRIRHAIRSEPDGHHCHASNAADRAAQPAHVAAALSAPQQEPGDRLADHCSCWSLSP